MTTIFTKIDLVQSTIVFFLMAVTDVIWVLYIRRTAQGKSLVAASLSALMSLTAAFVVLSYIENKWYLLPTALGAFVGTLISIHYDKEKNP